MEAVSKASATGDAAQPGVAERLVGTAFEALGVAIGATAWAAQRAQKRGARMAGSAASGVVGLFSAALSVPGAALAGVASARRSAFRTLGDIQKQGLSVWTAETLRNTGEAVSNKADAVYTGVEQGVADAQAKLASGAEVAKRRAIESAKSAQTAARDLKIASRRLASEKSFQATFVSATGGAVACATGGGVTGMVVGGGLGAAAGLPMALFTFGLSIPLGALLGGGTGLLTGATVGATAGAVGGGGLGYGVYAKRDKISEVANLVASKANSGADYVKGTAHKSFGHLKEMASGRRARAGTGSTGGMD